ncbi:hypothetical protein [Ruicaihuangia caeni]|uniref:Ammonium transporter AmtB-like domain-containing protein n=1 Tax=Ruicaihuangia caeni TaxID=3042517 RepID=A0AAW6T4N0_9MICO|nr:hypothetical protein [Klugiella sp. YN-L-19]MDI2098041.1 hypothetical protein [Klugiella sp. YN-L-19]
MLLYTLAVAAACAIALERWLQRRFSRRKAVTCAIVWTLAVCLPLAWEFFGLSAELLGLLGTIDVPSLDVELSSLSALSPPSDFAGGLIFALPLGAALLVFSRRSRTRTSVPWWGAAYGAIVVLTMTAAAELVITPALLWLLVGGALTAVSGGVGAAIAELIADRRVTARGIAIGVLAGACGAATATAWLTWQWAIVIGVAGGAIGHLLGKAISRRRTDAESARLGSALVAGPAVAALLLGLFGLGSGLVHTGSPAWFIDQATGVALALAWALGVAWALRLTILRRASEPPPR